MSHCKSWSCMKPDGDGCDGDHCNEVIENLRAENLSLKSHHTALKTRIGELEYWIECELEWMDCRGDEDCDHCVGVWLLAESSKPLPGSDSNPPHPAEKGSGT